MDRRRHRVRIEQRMELVVERAPSLYPGDVLGHAREPVAVLDVVESLREPGGQVADLRAEDGDQPSLEQGVEDLVEMVLSRRCRARRLETPLLAQDRPVQLLEVAARLDPELLDQHPAPLRIGMQRLRLPARSVE